MVAPAPLNERRDFLLSIRPQYAELIVGGEKTVELRRRFPTDIQKGALALIYCTSPTQAIIGAAIIKAVECLPISKLWRNHGANARIDRKAFDEYFFGRSEGFALVLSKAQRFKKQHSADKLKKAFGFVAPQSFVYLPEKYYSLLGHDQLQAIN